MPDYRGLAEFRYQLRRFQRFSEQQAKAVGLEAQQHQLLLAIRGLPADDLPTVARLAERLQLRHHSVVGLIDRLEDRGLVRRRADSIDHRKVLVELTPLGERMLENLSQAHEKEISELAPGLIQVLESILHSSEPRAKASGQGTRRN